MEKKVVLVVGGASGIGRAIARRLATAGARVVVADRSGPGAEEVAREFGDAGLAIAGDVTVTEDVVRFVATTVEQFGSLDVCVNSAGVGAVELIHQHTEKTWDRVLDVCLKGVFLTTSHASAQMITQGTGGVILNIASINARQPAEGYVAYCSAKAGVEMLTRVAAMELGRYGIRVVGIGPGFVDTPLTERVSDAGREAFVEKTPLGRTGTVDDIASAAAFLVGEEASWITGETLFVDGAALTREYPPMVDLLGLRRI
jgi:NAD(P)-dependent dehydrogenase (short-subunit alcohol dehydrogenase family)